MKQRISGREFQRWAAYDKLDPIGRDRIDYLFTWLVHTLIAINTPKNRSVPTFESLLPRWGMKPKRKTWRDIWAVCVGVEAAAQQAARRRSKV